MSKRAIVGGEVIEVPEGEEPAEPSGEGEEPAEPSGEGEGEGEETLKDA